MKRERIIINLINYVHLFLLFVRSDAILSLVHLNRVLEKLVIFSLPISIFLFLCKILFYCVLYVWHKLLLLCWLYSWPKNNKRITKSVWSNAHFVVFYIHYAQERRKKQQQKITLEIIGTLDIWGKTKFFSPQPFSKVKNA